MILIKTYPSKIHHEKKYYPIGILNKFYKLNKDEEFLRRFNLFEETNKGKKIGKKKWRELAKEFMIDGRPFYNKIYFGEIRDFIKKCDKEQYVTYNGRITTVEEYNNSVEIIIDFINCLKYYDDCIIFEGNKYGIPPVLKNIHRENDCFGNIIFISPENYGCDRCGKNLTECVADIYKRICRCNTFEMFKKYIIIQ